jgi:hypothetical protein
MNVEDFYRPQKAQNNDDCNRPWLHPIKIDDSTIFECRGLKLIGIRLYPYDGHNGEAERKAKCIQKSLYGRTNWFYFCKGFTVHESQDHKIQSVTVEQNAFDSTFLLYTKAGGTKISISAIVGQNGTGKSTIVDNIIRLINNLSAAILGEYYNFTKAQHLHYIDNVYASLAVYIDKKVYVITCKGRKLWVQESSEPKFNNQSEEYIFSTCYDILDGTTREDIPLSPRPKFKFILSSLFYTLVSNYSLYAYNYRDYLYERTNPKRLNSIRQNSPVVMSEDTDFWLKGVFHKNDSYQTPIVIHPFRDNGYVDVQRVNDLGRQNLISLCFEKYESGGEESFPFRVINQTHHIVAFYFYPPEEKYISDLPGLISKKIGKELVSQCIDLLTPIRKFWLKNIKIRNNKDKFPWHINKALDYLVYKTIKVIWSYIPYQETWKSLIDDSSQENVDLQLRHLLKDSSHRTLKIRQTAAYLKYYSDKDYYLNRGITAKVDDIYNWMSTKIGEQLYASDDYHKVDIEDLLPPPFVNVVLQLVYNEHLKAFNEGSTSDIIPFEGLSSGERQIAYTISNIIYHLKNIQSGKHDINSDPNHVSTIKYDYINILLDEVELYFHPDLQRRFINLLLNAISGLNLNQSSGINITLVTHSPFVLSDIPESNVLYLERNGSTEGCGQTFAANIHDLFNNTFILPYTIGEYAQTKISEIVDVYNKIFGNRSWNCLQHDISHEYIETKLSGFKYIANQIGDRYLHVELTDMVSEIESWVIERRQNNRQK